MDENKSNKINMEVLGLDIGGTGIKGAIVDTKTGQLLTERVRVLTPQPSTAENMAKTIKEIISKLDYKGEFVGVGFPTLIRDGIVQFTSNIDESWLHVDISKKFEELVGFKFFAINDADAAGIAEAVYGKTKETKGLVMFLTIGTGIGSALIYDGKLIPNSEFGKVEFKGDVAEAYASNKTRKEKELSWKQFGKRLNKYLIYLDMLFSPKTFILGGGVSKKLEKYNQYLTTKIPVIPSQFLNAAGVIGAAYFAAEQAEK